MSGTNQPWFAVRCLFRNEKAGVYEERTILVRASGHKQAIKLAEKDAVEYSSSLDLKYCGYADTFHIFDPEIKNGTEIFSLIRNDKVEAETYINRYLSSGTERRSK